MFRHNRRIMTFFLVLAMIFGTVQGSFAATDIGEGYGSQREYIASLIKAAGMKDEMIGEGEDQDALAKSLGFLDKWKYDPTSKVTDKVKESMDASMTEAYQGLSEALSKDPMEPYFVNGMAQPIFYYGDSKYYDTTEEGVVRFVVYVESELDTDGDGKLDLIKALVQMPRAGLEGAKLSTIFEARPYIEGVGSQRVPEDVQVIGDNFLAQNPLFNHKSLYARPEARVPAGETTTADVLAKADYKDWYYNYKYDSKEGSASIETDTGNESEYEDLNWYDYYLVRGFAVVESAGIGSAGSEGLSSCGADIEISAFKNVIEWITGDRKAYSDKTGNMEIKADWSNGKVGMTGRSYAGTTQFALATTGVKGLETIVPVAGIASWYDYTNSQGVPNSIPYTTGLAWFVNSRLASPTWDMVSERYSGYSQLMRREESALKGDYGDHWARRDYTVDNWYRDWGPSKIKAPMLIVHGANDDNVRPKNSMLMYEAGKKANVETKMIWHQGHHMTPTYPQADPNAKDEYRPYSMYVGDNTYDEVLNMWFSHHLYDVDNKIVEKLPDLLAQDNDSGKWESYDSMNSEDFIVLNEDNRVVGSKRRLLSENRYEEVEDYSDDFPLLDHEKVKYVGDESAQVSKDKLPMGANTPEPANVPELNNISGLNTISVIDSSQGSRSWQNFLDAPTAASALYSKDISEDVTVKGVVPVNFRAALTSLGENADEPLRVHAKLVEVASPGETLNFYGGNAVGAGIEVKTIKEEGSWQGGGIESQKLVEFVQSNSGTYREIAKGWMDLNNPKAGFESHTANREDRISAKDNIGVFHDYTIFLQPAVHTVKEGSRLALIITTGAASPSAYTGDNAFTFVLDNDATNISIPVDHGVKDEDKELSIKRLEGSSRIQTAIEVSKEAYTSSDSVVLAGYDGEVDALTGTLLAKDKGGPLLLTLKNKVHRDLGAELERLKAKTIYILGGNQAVSKEVEDELSEKYRVVRVAGSNRVSTAAAVAKEVKGSNAKHIFLAKGYGVLADALAIGPVSGLKDMPVLLSRSDKLPQATIDTIKDLGVTHITIVGGNGAVSKEVEEGLKDEYTVDRVSGSNRQNTALAIAGKYFTNPKNSILANGYIYADALVGGYLGAKNEAPILLTNTDKVSESTVSYIKTNSKTIYVLGGRKAISDLVVEEIQKN